LNERTNPRDANPTQASRSFSATSHGIHNLALAKAYTKLETRYYIRSKDTGGCVIEDFLKFPKSTLDDVPFLY